MELRTSEYSINLIEHDDDYVQYEGLEGGVLQDEITHEAGTNFRRVFKMMAIAGMVRVSQIANDVNSSLNSS